ncbi:MAG: hypothetical protein HFI49_01480 [Bacilli bacterium]|jgi:hypothetical protein|nr:hypothetical protein [Bacilli bacterium]
MNYADLLNNNSNNSNSKKKGSKVKKIFGGLALTAAIGLGIVGYSFRGNIASFIKGFGKEDVNPDDLLAFSETIPLDRDGIISITYPFVDRTFDEINGKYSLPDSYDFVYIGDSESPSLSVVKNGELEPDNIINFESTTGYPKEIIGVKKDYANFLDEAGEMKATALSDDNSNNSKLVLENYEVPNVYSLSAGFKLYCENEEINKQALLAYIAEDGTNVYVIPANLIDEFVVVTEDEFTIIGKYNEFKERIAEVYVQYESNRLNNGTQTGYGR